MDHVRTRDVRKAIPLSVQVVCLKAALVRAQWGKAAKPLDLDGLNAKDQVAKLKLALADAMGLPFDTQFNFDHTPALCLRRFDEETGDFIPHQNDPDYIVVRTKADHDRKTFGNGATTAGSDIQQRAHGRRLVAITKEHHQALHAKAGLCEPPQRKPSRLKSRGFEKNGPKQKIQSRGFEKGPKQKIPSRPFNSSRKKPAGDARPC